MSNNEPSFQRYAFDQKLGGRRGIGELRQFIDDDEISRSGNSFGFQIKIIRSPEKDIPEWSRTAEGIQKVLLTAFPNLHTNPKQRSSAGRWAQVIHFYFRLGYTWSEIASEMNVKPNVVLMIIRGVKYTAEGKTWNGTPRKRIN